MNISAHVRPVFVYISSFTWHKPAVSTTERRDVNHRVICLGVWAATVRLCLYAGVDLSVCRSFSEQILLKDGHQVTLEVDVNGVGLKRGNGRILRNTLWTDQSSFFLLCAYRFPPAPLLLAAARHLPLLVGSALCGRGGRRWGLLRCGRGLWGISGRGWSWGCWSKRRLLLLAPASIFLSAARLLHCVFVITATKSQTETLKRVTTILNNPCSRPTYRSFSCSFRASWFWAFSCLSLSSFSRAARRNCSKLSLEERTKEAGVDWDLWARLAQEPMFFNFTSWMKIQNHKRVMLLTHGCGFHHLSLGQDTPGSSWERWEF